jgi:hypothetical protein
VPEPVTYTELDVEQGPGHSIRYSALTACSDDNTENVQTSVQIPRLIRCALSEHHAGVHGTGIGKSIGVHVQDLVMAYIMLLCVFVRTRRAGSQRRSDDLVSRRRDIVRPESPYVFCSSETFTWLELSEKIGRRLHARDLIPSSEVTPFSDTALRQHLLVLPVGAIHGYDKEFALCGSNWCDEPVKLRKAGWRESHPRIDGTLDDEIDAVLAERA